MTAFDLFFAAFLYLGIGHARVCRDIVSRGPGALKLYMAAFGRTTTYVAIACALVLWPVELFMSDE